MSGTIIPVFGRVTLQRTDTSTTGSSIVEFGLIDASQFKEGTLQVRIHPGGSMPASATTTVELRRVAPTPEDPTSTYEDTAAAVLSVAVAVADLNAAPASKSQTVSTALGGLLRPRVTLTTAGTAPPTFKVTLSADLVVKE